MLIQIKILIPVYGRQSAFDFIQPPPQFQWFQLVAFTLFCWCKMEISTSLCRADYLSPVELINLTFTTLIYRWINGQTNAQFV